MNMVKRNNRSDRSLSRFHEEMNDLFNGMFRDWSRSDLTSAYGGWWPAIDVSEQDDSISIKAELPGVKSEDVEVSVHDGMLTISGEKKADSNDGGEGYCHCERRYGVFRRDIQLPAGADPDKVEAACRDGVLTVTVPKTEKAKARRIEVK